MDFCVVPAITSLYCDLVILRHDHRLVVHVNTAFAPTAAWVVRQ
jgi:hypothetical protein